MSTGPCEAAPIARDCQFNKMVVVRPLVPKGLTKVVIIVHKTCQRSDNTQHVPIKHTHTHTHTFVHFFA